MVNHILGDVVAAFCCLVFFSAWKQVGIAVDSASKVSANAIHQGPSPLDTSFVAQIGPSKLYG